MESIESSDPDRGVPVPGGLASWSCTLRFSWAVSDPTDVGSTWLMFTTE